MTTKPKRKRAAYQAIRVRLPAYDRMTHHASVANQTIMGFMETLIALWESAGVVQKAKAMQQQSRTERTQP